MPMPKGNRINPYLRFKSNLCFDKYGCWIWIGPVSTSGYGLFKKSNQSKNQMAHRYSYEAVNGEILEGLVIDHLCRKKLCVNPNHLEAVTQSINSLRGLKPQQNKDKAAKRTHCNYGHELTPENILISHCKRGDARSCRECKRISWRKWKQKNVSK